MRQDGGRTEDVQTQQGGLRCSFRIRFLTGTVGPRKSSGGTGKSQAAPRTP